VLTSQAVGRAHVEARADLDLRAELRERVYVRVEPAPADHVAAGRRHAHRAEAREQRPREQERGAHPAAQLLVQLTLAHIGGRDANLVRSGPLDVGSDIREQSDHRVDIADARDVRQPDRLVREQGTPRGSVARRFCFQPRGRSRTALRRLR
jgi:hypothetical protein